MIIIEGMDNTGKSTLAKDLAKLLGKEVTLSNRPTTEKEAVEESLKLVKMAGKILVKDRCHLISELVYGPLLRNHSLLSRNSWSWIVNLGTIYPLVIYCKPPQEKIISWGEREQMDGVKDNWMNLYYRYDWVMNKVKQVQQAFGGLFVEYDYTSNKCIIFSGDKKMEVITNKPTVEEFLIDLYKNQDMVKDPSLALKQANQVINQEDMIDERNVYKTR